MDDIFWVLVNHPEFPLSWGTNYCGSPMGWNPPGHHFLHGTVLQLWSTGPADWSWSSSQNLWQLNAESALTKPRMWWWCHHNAEKTPNTQHVKSTLWGFPEIWVITPKSSILLGFSCGNHITTYIYLYWLGYPSLWKPPCFILQSLQSSGDGFFRTNCCQIQPFTSST